MTPRFAVFAAFIAFGIGYGIWAGTIATVALRSGISPQMLGFAITGFIAANLIGMAGGGILSRSVAGKPILLGAIAAAAASLAVLMQTATPESFIIGLIVFGVANGLFDGSMNAEGTMVEADLGRPILVGFHASSSFAVAVTAILGSLIAVRYGTIATAVISVIGYIAGGAVIAVATPGRRRVVRDTGKRREAWRFGRPILLLGLIIGISIAGETAAIMFSAPALTLQAPELAGYAGFGASAFAFFQGFVRMFADHLRRRLGDLRVMELSILGALVGFIVVTTSVSLLQSAVGFALVGIGTACLVPCGFSLAPSYSGLAAAQALGIVAVVSALPRVPAPLAFGDVAGRFDYSIAFGLNVVLFAVAFGLVFMLKRVMTVRKDGAMQTLPETGA